jgi:hypothetical protein
MTNGVARRRVLAALAALSTLTLSDEAGATDTRGEVTVNSMGNSRLDIEPGDAVWSDAAIKCQGQDATIDITATHRKGDRLSNVEFRAYNDALTLWLGLSPERAREVAADLRIAADHAENGGEA